MKSNAQFFKQVVITPIGISISVVHWIVGFYAIYGETHSQSFHFTDEPLLTQWLYMLNSPALTLSGLIFLALISVIGENTFTVYFGLFLSFVLITFQWLIIGNAISYIIDSIKQKELKLLLFNE